MATAVGDEYLEVDGLPLDTHAWRTIERSSLYDPPDLRGSGVELSQRRGEEARAPIEQARSVRLRMAVFGTQDSDGNAHADSRMGLQANLDELKTKLRPRLSGDGTMRAVHRMPDGSTREARCHLNGRLRAEPSGATAMRAVVRLLLPEGVWRDTTLTSASATDSFPLSVSNPGSADQFDSTITLSGDATSVTLSNGTWGPDTDLTVAVDLNNGDVTIDTGDMTAVQGSADVVGSVSHSTDGAFPARWLPLLAGQDNSVGVSHDGTTLTVSVEHAVRWL